MTRIRKEGGGVKACELIERLKLVNPLSEVEIEIKRKEYEDITTFSSDIDYIRDLGAFGIVRIVGKTKGRVDYEN